MQLRSLIGPLIALFTAFGFLHLLLYVTYPRERGNLLFSIATLSLAGGLLIESLGSDAFPMAGALRLTLLAAVYMAMLGFLRVTLGRPRSSLFWPFAAVAAVQVLLRVLLPGSVIADATLLLLVVAFFAECVRTLWHGHRAGHRDVGLLAAGIAACSMPLFMNLLAIAGHAPREQTRLSLNLAGLFSLVLCSSIFLALRFGRTNVALERQLAQVQALSARELEQERRFSDLKLQQAAERAEHERRTHELEQARELQLSMLPARVPDLPHLDIAAYLQPATEVGGDYYDFHISEPAGATAGAAQDVASGGAAARDGTSEDDGRTLTIAVGDATGHGLRAGTMVTAVKALFTSSAHQADPAAILSEASRTLTDMNLPGLFMSLAIAKIRGCRIELSLAAMPPAIVYRDATRRVETLAAGGVPLGSFWPFAYDRETVTLAPGDALVLMSDGFPERFNPQDDILGYDYAASVLADIAHAPAAGIIAQLVRLGDAWAEGRKQDDDVTFVVIKARERTAS